MSDQSRQVLDVEALAAAIATVARHRQISMRVVAAETGLSASTITRLSQGQKPDADGLVTLLAWLKADAAAFAAERPQNGKQVNHKDGDPRNNDPSNLELREDPR